MEARARRAAIEAEMHDVGMQVQAETNHVGVQIQAQINGVARHMQREMGRRMLGMGGWW